ncbi:MAG TPA: molybdate ABC transporter substrate-binding protein [Casimicrobiaceae bacterium]
MRNIPSYTAALLILAAALPACGAELVVSAAASLTNAFRDIGKLFESAHPGSRVAFNFAATDVLLAQVSKGAPADVFAAADEDAMDRAEREGLLLPGSRRDFAANRLVLIVPARHEAPSALGELALPRFGRIAMGSPRTVPAGRYAKAALERAQLWDRIAPRCVFALNVRQVLDYVAREEVDAGFVYATDAALLSDKVKIAIDVPTPTAVRYPVAVLRGSRYATEARTFVDLLGTEPAKKMLSSYGFMSP